MMPVVGRLVVALALAASLPLGLMEPWAAGDPPGNAPAGKNESPRRLPGHPPEVVRVEGAPPQRVELSVSVLDAAGEPVRGLQASDFLVRERGALQSVVDFGRESDRQDRPLSAAILVDRSGSIGRQLSRWRQASWALLSGLRPIDEVSVATFTSDVQVLQDFTSDARRLAALMDQLDRAEGGTRIFRAVDETLEALHERPGRKVLFLLTDGLDNDLPDAWSATSSSYLTDLVRRLVGSQVTVVTILPGPTGRPYLAAQDLAVRTGGWWLYPSDDLPALVGRLGERLLESYYIAYDSAWPLSDPRQRRVEVSLSHPLASEMQVRTVYGVFAPAD